MIRTCGLALEANDAQPGRTSVGANSTPSQIQNAQRLIDAGEPATQLAKDMGMSRATLCRRIATINAV